MKKRGGYLAKGKEKVEETFFKILCNYKERIYEE